MSEPIEKPRTTGYAIRLHCHWCRNVPVGPYRSLEMIDDCEHKQCALHPFRPAVPPPRKPMKLSGDHCQCPTCREYFNSTRAFDKHRTGLYAPMQRRCLAVDEMRAIGMLQNAGGFWITKKFESQPLRAGQTAAIGSTPCPDSPSGLMPVGWAIPEVTS